MATNRFNIHKINERVDLDYRSVSLLFILLSLNLTDKLKCEIYNIIKEIDSKLEEIFKIVIGLKVGWTERITVHASF